MKARSGKRVHRFKILSDKTNVLSFVLQKNQITVDLLQREPRSVIMKRKMQRISVEETRMVVPTTS